MSKKRLHQNEVKADASVNPGDQSEVNLEPEDYIMRLKVLSDAEGTIEVRVEKNN